MSGENRSERGDEPALEAGPARAGDRPVESTASAWKSTFRRTGERIRLDRVSMAAGSLAYHFFLALFPAVIAALGVLSLVRVGSRTLHAMTHAIATSLPAGTASVFDAAVAAASKHSSSSTIAVVVGILVALWSSSSAMAVLQQALDVAYQVPADRSFLARRQHALPLMAVTALLGTASAVLTVLGKPIGSAIVGTIPISGGAFTVAWTIVRWSLTFVLVSVLFAAYYSFGPNRTPRRWQWISPGGLLATAVFLLASLAFSYYVSAFGSYSKTYGSFAGVAILIFWLYLSGLAVLIGGELNAELERRASARRTVETLGTETAQPGAPGRALPAPAVG